jgi:aminoglycoside phosphotransferase (APT) family kinase protein
MTTTGSRPPADVIIDVALVRALLEEQHADLAHLDLADAGEGWDNRLFRLGNDAVVRLPRRAVAAALIENEHRWLPQLSAALPLPIPVPVRAGRPGCGFLWPWSVVPWFEGRTALAAPPRDAATTAVVLGGFVRALHCPAPASAPLNRWRGVPLASRTHLLDDHLEQAGLLVDRRAAIRLWNRALAAPSWPGPPLWIHGDLHPGNLVVKDGRVAAVIDFGDLAAGDPATDLSVAWMLFPPAERAAFIAAARGPHDPIDEGTTTRARAWALALGLAFVTHAADDPAFRALGLATIEAALVDVR